VVWDNASRVTNLKDLLTTTQANNQGFGYDALDRLTATTLGTATTASQILAYDAIGNRTSATINGIIATYNLPTNSHKLTSTVGGTNPRAFTYDAMGNLTFDGKYTYTYLNNGRINTVTWVTGTAPNTTTNTATYNINALGQRVRKVTPSSVVGTRRFMYDEAGRLAGEYDGAGKLVQETIWLGDLPVATLRPKSGSVTTPIAVDLFYVHADHLGTPRVITRPSDNKVVWKWDSVEAFGNSAPNENPSALGAFTYNLRMPGQYFDKETGTFYNYFRDYDPSLGRYVQSDPIGLGGGMNTYGYSMLNPLAYVDPMGLLVWRNSTTWATDLATGQAYSAFPGQRKAIVKAKVLGLTATDWAIQCRCACKGGIYKFEEFTVDFKVNVHIRPNLSSEKYAWVLRGEKDHVSDFMTWANGRGKKIALDAENRYKQSSFASMEACEGVTADGLSGLLASSIDTATRQTISDYDDSGKHTYGGPNQRQ
jgi:RHS repeat-associated protein